jgi:hypothetical protein
VVVHGGLRPGTVRFAAGTEQPYLTGFGVAAGSTPPAAGDLTDVENVAPEQVIGAPVDRRTDVYAFGGLLFRCLTGVAPFRGGDPGAVLAAVMHAEPPRMSAIRPELPGELDRVVATAMAKDPAFRFDTCAAVVEAAAAAVGMGATAPPPHGVAARSRRIGLRVVLAVLVVVALLGAVAVAAPHVAAAMWPTADDLARVPAAVRGDCDLAAPDPRLPNAQRLLRCTDGQDVLVGLYPDEASADAAYRGLVAASPGARSGQGDCARTTGWEHRYPGVGDFRGRVLCDKTGTVARMAWVDRPNRAVAVAERADGNSSELYRTWSRWVELAAFPVPPEQELLDVMADSACQRAPAGPLDGLDGVVAAVECTPQGSGASTVAYYRFADREGLRRAYESDVALYVAPSGVFCPDAAASGAGESDYHIRGVPFGRIACGTNESGVPAVTWTSDALLVMGRATGSDRAALFEWSRTWTGPDQQAAADAINQQATPPFPTAQEDELLRQIPPASRRVCMRTSADTMLNHVGDTAAVGITCSTDNGPESVYYYRIADPARLNAAAGPSDGPDCATVAPGSYGAARYTRPDGSTGVLTCGTNDAGWASLTWSDEQAAVFVLAFDRDPATLLGWWQTEAGPL